MPRIWETAMLGAGLAALAIAAPTAAVPDRVGKPTGQARTNVHKPAAHPQGGAHAHGGTQRSGGGGQAQRTNNRNGQRNVVAGNTVVVGKPAGGGYYDNGRYHDRPDWDDDDNDFLEFVGKTAAVTAGVSVVTAVIGDVSRDKPDNCQPITVGGEQYLNCNGVAYQQVSGGYQVVAPPQR